MKNVFAFIFGGLFALGLMISGMANPEKVLNFLDVLGNWDPSLALVMAGAIIVAFLPFQRAVKQSQPKTIDGQNIQLPTQTRIDKKLIIGSALFGIGWGIAGICPAPSLTLIGLGHYQILYFVAAMIVSIGLYDAVMRKK